ncbi:MAG: hypothetical protein IJ703_10765 [Eubacterium sp.]|nr:hypothetical protein [Eubacterium sp.]
MKGDIMNKQAGKVILIIGIVLLTLSAGMLFFRNNPKTDWSSNWNRDVIVTDGMTPKEGGVSEFTISEAGTYKLKLSWAKDKKANDIGFVTGCVLIDKYGRVIYGTSAMKGYIDKDIDLQEGNYTLNFTHITTEEDYKDFAKKYLCGDYEVDSWAEGFDFETFPKDQVINIKYEMSVSKQGVTSNLVYGLVFVILISGALIVIILTMFTEGRRLESRKYDERQELERGRGFKYGFFTMIIYNGLAMCLDSAGAVPNMERVVLYFSGILIGIVVHVVYCIWHESYFALNENKNVIMITFAGIAIVNLLLGINTILSGEMFVNGKLTFRVTNLLCAGMFLVLFITMFLKKVSDKAKGVDLEDEEEEA